MAYDAASEKRKLAFADSLKRMMEKKPLSKITINDLAKDSGNNRNTFYYHFQTIYDLLKWMLKRETVEVLKGFDLMVNAEDTVSFVISYVETNRHLLRCAYDTIGREGMRQFFYEDFISMISGLIDRAEVELQLSVDPSFKRFMADFYTAAMANMLIDLFQQDVPYERETIVHDSILLIRASISGTLQGWNEERSAANQ